MANMMILFFLFSEGKTEDNLKHIFNLFDADGNKVTYTVKKYIMNGIGSRFFLWPFYAFQWDK
jgi:hypothetical protein